MNISKTRLKQIIKEEIQKFQEAKESWGDHWDRLKAATLKELQENDVSGPGDWQDPAIIIASAVDNLESSDEQDHLHFAEEVIETHNSSEWAREMGGIGVEVEDVMEALRSSDKHWASY